MAGEIEPIEDGGCLSISSNSLVNQLFYQQYVPHYRERERTVFRNGEIFVLPNGAGRIMRLRIGLKDTLINDDLFVMSFRLFVFDDDIFRWSNTEIRKEKNEEDRNRAVLHTLPQLLLVRR